MLLECAVTATLWSMQAVVIVGALDRETVDIETARRIVAAGIMASAATFERASGMVRDHNRFHTEFIDRVV
jgi:hypothetical protein